MVVRFPIRCNGCGAVIRLRLAVGPEKRHAFAFECRRCNQVIRGVHLLGRPPKTHLRELAGARKLKEDPEPDQSVMLDPTFLRDLTAPPEAFSAFLLAHNRLGPRLIPQINRAKLFMAIAADVAPDLRRAIRNYESGQDRNLVNVLRKHVGDPPGDTPAGRLQALHRLAVITMSPVAASPSHVRVMRRFFNLPMAAKRRHPQGFEQMLLACRRNDLVAGLELDNLKVLPRVYDLKTEFLPVLVDWDVEHSEIDVNPNLQFGRVGRFDEAKSLYVDAYEAAMRSMTVITAVTNVLDRGSPDSYPLYPDRKIRQAASMGDFHRQNHAPKLSLVAAMSAMRRWPGGLLEPKLRNAIGHNRISLDPLGERVTFPADRGGTMITLSYANFLVRVLRAVRCVHEANQMIRMVHAAELLLPQ